MSIITVLLFFVYTYGLGFTLTRLVKNSSNLFERNLIRVGVGLGVLPVLGLVLDIVHVPLDWKIFLGLSLIYPLYYIIRHIRSLKPNLRFKFHKSDIYLLIVLLLFLFSFFMYAKGAFGYPYLEDDDPWGYAVATKYIANQKTISGFNTRYLNPYPPAYSLLMGILHQTSLSLNWTLKFFNVLIISLGIIFFYFFVRKFTKNNNIALASAFVLAMIPSYLTHFIWAHSLIITLIFPAFYSLESIKDDSKWAYVSALVIASILLTQPTQAVKFGFLFLIYFLIKSVIDKKLLKGILLSGFGGFLLSLLWWYNKFGGIVSVGIGGNKAEASTETGFLSKAISSIQSAFPYDQGTATRVYTFNDYFVAQSQNLINNPVGVGKVLFILLIIYLVFLLVNFLVKIVKNRKTIGSIKYYFFIFLGLMGGIALILFLFGVLVALVYLLIVLIILGFILIKTDLINKERFEWVIITLTWFLFTYLGMNSMTFNLPVGSFAFRFWMLFAIPASILMGAIIYIILQYSKSIEKQIGLRYVISTIILLLIVLGVWFTSGLQKYDVNTAIWGPGGAWKSEEEFQGYMTLANLDKGTKVFPLAGNHKSRVLGMDMFNCYWCKDEDQFREETLDKSAIEISNWLKSKQYRYAIIDTYFILNNGQNVTNDLLNDYVSSGLFTPVYQNSGFVLLKVD